MNQEGMTVLYTTHYMEEAQELSDHIAVMDQGQIVARGTHDELVKIVRELDRIVLTIDTEGVQNISAEDGELCLLVDDSNIVLPRLFESATGAGVRITTIQIQEPNLEGVFLHLTGRALRD